MQPYSWLWRAVCNGSTLFLTRCLIRTPRVTSCLFNKLFTTQFKPRNQKTCVHANMDPTSPSSQAQRSTNHRSCSSNMRRGNSRLSEAEDRWVSIRRVTNDLNGSCWTHPPPPPPLQCQWSHSFTFQRVSTSSITVGKPPWSTDALCSCSASHHCVQLFVLL